MGKIYFSEEQLTLIKELAEVLKKCKIANIHIAGVDEYEVNQFEDANENSYIGIS